LNTDAHAGNVVFKAELNFLTCQYGILSMKAICFEDIEQIATREISDPKLVSSTDAIVQVSLAGLCGSDLHPFFGRESGLDRGTVMGHELVGTIVELGSDVKSHSVGDRVYVPFSTNCGSCYYCLAGITSRCSQSQLFGWMQDGQGLEGCQAELVRVPLAEATLMKADDRLSDEAALLLGDNFSTGFYCAEMAEVQPGGTYMVIGCGTVGLLCIVAAKSMGAETIVAVDLVESRRKMAESLGAIAVEPDNAVAEIHQRTDGRGADAVMELVGLPPAQVLAFQAVRPGGILSVIGCHCTPNFEFSPVDAYDKNLTYKTGRCPARHYMDKLSSRVADGEFDLDPFITHHFSIDESVRAYDVFSNRKESCVKAAIKF
jgi:2-desacetyl-2-hydroxyethyl bacteriochlorophyllide A dehydrogenase